VLEVYFPWVSWLFRVAAATQKGDKFAQLNMEEITGLTGPTGLLVQNITVSQAVNIFLSKADLGWTNETRALATTFVASLEARFH
jgi:hypothetical protein